MGMLLLLLLAAVAAVAAAAAAAAAAAVAVGNGWVVVESGPQIFTRRRRDRGDNESA